MGVGAGARARGRDDGEGNGEGADGEGSGGRAGELSGGGSGEPRPRVDFEELWSHRQALSDLCRRIVGDPATAEDVVQDTYIRALHNLEQLERRPSLMPWLATVARRRSIDELRRRRRSTPVDAMCDEATRPELDPGESTAAGETVERVRRALTALTERERQLLTLRVDLGLSLAELADEDESSVDSVRSVLSRARTKLRISVTTT